MPRKGEGPGVSIRVLQRNGTNRTDRVMGIGSHGDGGWEVPEAAVGKPGDPGKLMV